MKEGIVTIPDRFAQMNPAFTAVSLAWMCSGFREEREKREELEVQNPRLLFLWAMTGMTLLAPSSIRDRLKKSAAGKLSVLLSENPEWRAAIPVALLYAAPLFWRGVKFGVATGTLTVDRNGLIECIAAPQKPDTEAALDLRLRATVLGKLFGKEDGDRAIASILGIRIE